MPINTPATTASVPKTQQPIHSDRELAVILIVIFVCFTAFLYKPLGSDLALPFFPEIVFLGAISAVFFFIYRYLSTSLVHKKEVLIDLIKSKYSETISRYEDEYREDLEKRQVWSDYELFKKDIYSKSLPFDYEFLSTTQPGRTFTFVNGLEDAARKMEGPEDPMRKTERPPYDQHRFNLVYSHHLRNVAFLAEQKLEKFRLRDLEQIYNNPTAIDTIYFQRTKEPRPIQSLKRFDRMINQYTYGGVK